MRSLLLFIVMLSISYFAHSSIDDVRERGKLICGVNSNIPGFAMKNEDGIWGGLTVDMCKAIATTIFNDTEKVEFVITEPYQKFDLLANHTVDVLFANTTWTMYRDIKYGDFAVIYYHDGQGFLTKKSLNIKSTNDFNGKSICVNAATTSEKNIKNFLKSSDIKADLQVYDLREEVRLAYENEQCDILTSDIAILLSHRTYMDNLLEHIVLPDIISEEPLGVMVRHGENTLQHIARYSINCVVRAENYGVSSNSLASDLNSNLERLLGRNDDVGRILGISKDWCLNIISKVGNYKEIFDRNLGITTDIGLSRGVNEIWTKGGILFAPPLY